MWGLSESAAACIMIKMDGPHRQTGQCVPGQDPSNVADAVTVHLVLMRGVVCSAASAERVPNRCIN
jgi:hypothetical protein